eukprot:1145159-Pelagomonas_calceolata.AAC.1
MSPTHTQKDCVKSDLSALTLFAQLTVVAVRLLAGHQASYLCLMDLFGTPCSTSDAVPAAYYMV